MASRRGHHEGSIYQRHDHLSCPDLVPGPPHPTTGKPTKVRPDHKCKGRWTGAIDLGSVDGETRRRKPIYGKTRAEVIRKIGLEQAEIAEHGTAILGTMTLSKWMDHWMVNIASKRNKPSTLRGYRSIIKNYIKPAAGGVRLDRLNDEHVLAIHALAGKTSSTTAAHAHACLSKALKDAVRARKVRRNACDYVDKPRMEATDIVPLTLSEARSVLQHVADDRLAARWHMALLLGPRQGEALGLTWSAIDFETGRIGLEWQLQRVPYQHGCGDEAGDVWPCGKKRAASCSERTMPIRPGIPKRHLVGNFWLLPPKTKGSMRVPPMSPSIHAFLLKRRAEYELERVNYSVDYGLVFCRTDGMPIDNRKDWQRWREILGACRIELRAQHVARHTAATLLRAQGVDEATIMEILGHSEAITTRRYAHKDVSQQAAGVARLDEALGLDA